MAPTPKKDNPRVELTMAAAKDIADLLRSAINEMVRRIPDYVEPSQCKARRIELDRAIRARSKK